jgi:hypothetical protein
MLSVSERRRPTGYAVVTDPDKGVQEWDTFRCAHCGRIEHVPPPPAMPPGGTCSLCGHAMICDGCVALGTCDPLEKKLERIEARARFRQQLGV